MNQTLDMFFLRKRVLGKNYKFNLKPKYSKILKKPTVFYIICNFLSDEELFELYYTCHKFHEMIGNEVILENKILKTSLKKLKKKNEKSDETKDKEKELALLSENVLQMQAKFRLMSINSKLVNNKLSKLKELDELIANGGVIISNNNDKDFSYNIENIDNIEDKSNSYNLSFKLKELEKINNLCNQYSDELIVDNINKSNISINAMENKYFDIKRTNEQYFKEMEEKLKYFNCQLNKVAQEKSIMEFERKQSKNNIHVLKDKLYRISSNIYKNIVDYKDYAIDPQMFMIRNLDYDKIKAKNLEYKNKK